jgi:cytoskeletal protein RodZ
MQKRLTLQDLARSTKISPGTLEALENNDFGRLPAAIYTRSFLRQYAREVNLDPSETVRSYMQQIEAAAPAPPPAAALPPSRPVSIATVSDRTRSIVIDPRRLPVAAMTAAALVLAALFYLSWSSRGDEAGEKVGVAQAAAPDVVPAAPPAVAEPDATRAANMVPDVLRVELTITGPCWVSATADRAPALAKLLRAGDDQVLEARDELVLRLGEPSTVSVTINGQQARPLGRRGQPVTVAITRQNYRDLLAP